MFFATPAFDLDLFLLINQHWRNDVFDVLMPLLSSMTVLMICMTVALFFAVYKRGWRQVLLFVVLMVAMGGADSSSKFVKKQIFRVRPLNEIAGTFYREDGEWRTRAADFVRTKERGTSYPSAHAANTMCLAVLAMLMWPALRKWPLLLPLVVGYSRLYLGKHYPTDVVAGWLLGFVVAGLMWILWRTIQKQFLSHWEF